VIAAAGLALAYAPYALYGSLVGSLVILCAAFRGWRPSVASAVKVAAARGDRAVVLRLGRFRRASVGPGVFGIIPIIDTIPYWIDTAA